MTPRFLSSRVRPTPTTARRRKSLLRPGIEQLEDRLAPAAGLPPDLVVGRTLSAYSTADVTNHTLTVTYTVYNEQPDAVTGVLLRTALRPGVVVRSSSVPLDRSGSELAWSLGTLHGYDRASVALTVTLPDPLPTQVDGGAVAWGVLNAGAVTADTPAATLTSRVLSAAQLASTPEANTTDPFVQEQAAKLRYDPQAIFDYLNTDVGYESYTGSLRGARGTLWSAAGNSLDEASLGVALLRASGVPARYAHGTLSDALSKQLILSMFPASFQTVGYVPAGTPVADPANDPKLLGETRDHYWLQVDTGSGFQNADTSGLPGGALGTAFTTASGTFTEVADALRHKVEVKLDAEIYTQLAAAFGVGDGLGTTTVLDHTFNSVDLVGRPLTLGNFVNQSGAGFIITARTTTYSPYLVVGDEALREDQLPEAIRGTDFQEVMTNFPLGNQLLTGLFLNLTLSGPGVATATFDRALVDRIGFAARNGFTGAGVSVDPSGPPALTDLDVWTQNVLAGQENPVPSASLASDLAARRAALAGLSPGAPLTPQGEAAARQLVIDVTRQTAVDHAYYSDVFTRRLAAVNAVRAYFDSPRIVIAAHRVGVTGQGATGALSVDLRRDVVRVVPAPGQARAAAATFNMARGLNEAALEAALVQHLTGNAGVVSTATVFAAAAANHIPLVAIGAANLVALDGLDLAPEAKARITDAARAGYVVVVPTAAVPLGSTTAAAWYQIDPSTGEMIGVTQDGGHQAIMEYITTLGLPALFVGFILGTFVVSANAGNPDRKQDLAALKNGIVTLENGGAGWASLVNGVIGLLTLGVSYLILAGMAATIGVLNGFDPDASGLLFGLGVPATVPPNNSETEVTVQPNTPPGPVAGTVQAPRVSAAGQLAATWAGTGVSGFLVQSLTAAGATITSANGTAVGSGSVSLAPTGPTAASVAGSNQYSVTGSGRLTFYGPAAATLGVGGEWNNYSASVTGNVTVTLTTDALMLNGVLLPAGTYTITASAATLGGSGPSTSPAFSGSANVSVTNGTLALGRSTGGLTVGGAALDPANGAALTGYTGTLTVAGSAGTSDTATLSGTAADVLSMTATPAALTADQNTPATFQVNLKTSLADAYTLTAQAPPGWTVTVSAAGVVTVTPAPGLQSGTYPVRVVARSKTNPDLVAQTTVNVAIAATLPGIALAVAPDPVFTVPYAGAEIPSAFRATVRNLGPAADSYTLSATNLPAGFALLTSGTALTVPAGQTGIIGLYLQPTGGPLPAPGTVVSFDVTATSTTNPALTGTRHVTFTMPAVHGVTLAVSPSQVNTLPGSPGTATLTLTAVGNVPETITLTATAGVGLTVGGLPQPITLNPGQSTTVSVTLTPAAATPLNSTLAATLTATFGPAGSPATQTLQLAVRVVVPGADAIADAAVTAAGLGNTDLATQLNNLAIALTNLVQTPGSAVFQDQAVVAIDAIVRLLGTDADLAPAIPGLSAAHADLNAAATPADVQAAVGEVGNALAGVDAVLADSAAHRFTLTLSPNTTVALPGASATILVGLTNLGTQPTTYDLSVTGLPTNVAAAFSRTTVTLQPGETLFGGPNGVTLSLTETGNALVPVAFTVVAVAQSPTSIARTAGGALTVRDAFVRVTSVTPSPAFTDPGNTVAVSAKLLNAVNRVQTVQARYVVKDSGGAVVFTSPQVPVALGLQTSLVTVNFAPLDTTGFATGSYTIEVAVTDAVGNPVPGGTGTGSLLIGSPVTAALATTPATLPPGDSTVTSSLSLTTNVPLAPPFTLVGQTATTTVSSTIVIRGTTAYVAGSNGVDIVDVSDPTNPVKLSTFAQSLIVQGGYTVVRELPGDRIVVASTTTFNANGTRALVYSLADPLNPVLVSNTVIPEAFMTDFLVSGSVGLLTSNGVFLFGSGSNGSAFAQFGDVTAIDFDAPGGPVVTDRLVGTGNPPFTGDNAKTGGAVVNATTAYVTGTTTTGGNFTDGTGRLMVVNFADPANLTLVKEVLVPGTVVLMHVAVQGTTALVVGSNRGSLSSWNNTDADPSDDSGNIGNLTFTTLDVTDPDNPVVVSTVVTSAVFPRGDQPSSKLAVVPLGGGKFAVSLGVVNGRPVIFLVDASDPNNIVASALQVNAVVSEMTVSGGKLFTTSADGLLIYDVGSVSTVPVTVSVNVPTGTGVDVVPGSFNIPPTQIIHQAGFDTYEWDRSLAFGLAAETITWQSTVTNLQPGEARDVTLGGSVAFTAQGSPGAVALPPTTVAAAHIVSIDPPAQTVAPGGGVDYAVSVTNLHPFGASYFLSVVGLPLGWVTLPGSVFVAANGTATVTLHLAPEAFAALSDYGFAVTATDGAGTDDAVSAALTVAGTATPPDPAAHGVVAALTPAAATAGQGTSATYVLRVTNTGSVAETYTLSLVLPAGVSGVLDRDTITVQPGAGNFRDVRLTLTVADATTPASLGFTVHVDSPTASTSAAGTLTVVRNGVSVTIDHATGAPGDTFQVTVTNTGSVIDTFVLSVGGPGGLISTLAVPTVTLAPGASQTVTLTTTAASFALPGTLSLAAVAVSQGDPSVRDSANAGLTVGTTSGLTATIGPAVTVLPVSGSSDFVLTFTNTGNGEDAYAIELVGTTGPLTAYLVGLDGLPTQMIGTARLPGLSTGTVVIHATLTGAGAGTFTVRVRSLTNPALTSTSTATLRTEPVVVPPVVPPIVPPVVPPVVPPPPPRVPQPALVGGRTDGTAVVLAPSGGGYALSTTYAFFPGFPGEVRTATGDVTGDGVPDYVGGAGAGGGPRVVVIDGATGNRLADFFAFESTFTGGVYVSTGDLDGDGRADVIVTPDLGGGPVVVVYSGAKLAAGELPEAAQLNRFFGIEDREFRGGARAAAGDVDGDGRADLVVSAGFPGGPRIALFRGADVGGNDPEPTRLVPDFFAFEDTFRNGSYVALGDVNGDGFADLAFGGGPSGGPRARVVSGKALLAATSLRTLDDATAENPALQLANFFPGDPGLRGGVRVALKDADADGRADLVTGSGDHEPGVVRLYKAATLLAGGDADQTFDPFPGADLPHGAFVG